MICTSITIYASLYHLIIICSFYLLVESVLGFSQPVFMAFEVNGFVTVCVKLLEGRLERDVSVFLETREGSGVSSSNYRLSTERTDHEVYLYYTD